MAKLILKVNYYKPGRSKSMGGYAKYIATRENVEKNEDKVLHLKSTESQQELIEKLLRDFPESIHSEEYQAYCSDGTRENASEYITRTLEQNIQNRKLLTLGLDCLRLCGAMEREQTAEQAEPLAMTM